MSNNGWIKDGDPEADVELFKKVLAGEIDLSKKNENTNGEDFIKPVEEQNNANETRRQTFEGQVKKCPNCGAVLPSMTTRCPECGVEIRGAKASSALQKFYEDLKKGNDQEDVETITNFPIPNTREDFFEFLIMAKSEIEKDYINNVNSVSRGKHEAWVAKFKQCELKAKVLFMNDIESLKLANEILNSVKESKGTKLKYKKTLSKGAKTALGITGGIIGWGLLLFIAYYVGTYDVRAEKKRLESLEQTIEAQIQAEDYESAAYYLENYSWKVNDWAGSYDSYENEYNDKYNNYVHIIEQKMREKNE